MRLGKPPHSVSLTSLLVSFSLHFSFCISELVSLSLIAIVFTSFSWVLTKTPLLWLLKIKARSKFPFQTTSKKKSPHTPTCIFMLPITLVPVRREHVGRENKRTLAVQKRVAIMSHWGMIGRRGRIFYVTALSCRQQHQIGDASAEAPKSICRPGCCSPVFRERLQKNILHFLIQFRKDNAEWEQAKQNRTCKL